MESLLVVLFPREIGGSDLTSLHVPSGDGTQLDRLLARFYRIPVKTGFLRFRAICTDLLPVAANWWRRTIEGYKRAYLCDRVSGQMRLERCAP